jgi:hypothetical protein
LAYAGFPEKRLKMSDETLPQKNLTPRTSAFLDVDTPDDLHIVDVLIEERCPKLRASPAWPLAAPGALFHARLRQGPAHG